MNIKSATWKVTDAKEYLHSLAASSSDVITLYFNIFTSRNELEFH